ncbi:MAG: TylF/MycF/NovP-related O-methyltransferase [Cyclobacteriaceae bacterium]
MMQKNEVNGYRRCKRLFEKYREYTMTPRETFINNLLLCQSFAEVKGDIVECGVWKGGMSAAIAEVMGNHRQVHLFDSFEGLPPAEEIDGQSALDWQRDTTSPGFHDNCNADESFALRAMDLAGHKDFMIHKGWFDQTLPGYQANPIAILRLDGDWYKSIAVCLNVLFPRVATGGVVILDDYYVWEGCARAVHDYLVASKTTSRIRQWKGDVAYIIKQQ